MRYFWKADICTDGTPAGYGVYEVDGNKLTWRYKSAGYPIEHQFRAYPVGVSEDYPEYILANVWNWDENWKVEWYENGNVWVKWSISRALIRKQKPFARIKSA